MAANSRDQGRYAYIDSLRAIAAMLVLWVHVSELYKQVGPGAIASQWVHALTVPINAGRLGVVTFFAISGFVIPFSIKLGHRYPVREFLVTRFFRLYPAYWLSIPLGIYACQWLWGRSFSFGDFLVNLTMLEYIFDVTPAIGLYWTLAVELVFYLCCVVLVLTRSITNYRRIAVLILIFLSIHVFAVALTWSDGRSAWHGPTMWLVNLSVMFWGTLYRAHESGAATSRFETACTWGIAAFFVVGYPLLFTYGVHVPLAHTIGYSLGVLLFIVGTRIVRIQWRPLPWLGVISYSIYLFHPVVFSLVLRGLGKLPADSWWRSWHLGLYVLAILALTIGVSALIYRYVERPSILLGRRLAKAWFDAPAPEAVPAFGKAGNVG
jgi:peptidoglycan/LPS O-acetylase OafA/YrhL